MRHIPRSLASLAVAALLAVGCATDGALDDAARSVEPDPVAAPADDAAASDGDSTASDADDSDVLPEAPPPWPAERIARDLELLAAHTLANDAAWDEGIAAATSFLAAHSWPQGYTAEAIQRCRLGEPVPDLASVDATGRRIAVTFTDAVPAPDWRFPPTDERPTDAGLRVYRVTRTETISELDREPEVRTFTAHVGIDDGDRVLSFPACTAYLPAGRPEVARELDRAFGDLGPFTLMMTCDVYIEVGPEATLAMFLDDGWDVTLTELRTAFYDWCAWHWEAMAQAGSG
jgi:hypothetical protein